MAKDSPWFKFFTGEWANGSITLENYSVQGVFINVCCFYWSKQGDVTRKQLEKKIRSNKELNILFDEEILKIENEKVTINFLDSQIVEREKRSKQSSDAGKISAAKRAEKKQHPFNDRSTPVEISFNENPTIKNKSKKESKSKSKKDINKEEIVFFPNDILLDEKYKQFLNFRKEIKKAITPSSIELNKKKLMNLANQDGNKAIEIIEQSIANGWQGFFELQTNNNLNKGKQTESFSEKFFKGTNPELY